MVDAGRHEILATNRIISKRKTCLVRAAPHTIKKFTNETAEVAAASFSMSTALSVAATVRSARQGGVKNIRVTTEKIPSAAALVSYSLLGTTGDTSSEITTRWRPLISTTTTANVAAAAADARVAVPKRACSRQRFSCLTGRSKTWQIKLIAYSPGHLVRVFILGAVAHEAFVAASAAASRSACGASCNLATIPASCFALAGTRQTLSSAAAAAVAESGCLLPPRSTRGSNEPTRPCEEHLQTYHPSLSSPLSSSAPPAPPSSPPPIHRSSRTPQHHWSRLRRSPPQFAGESATDAKEKCCLSMLGFRKLAVLLSGDRIAAKTGSGCFSSDPCVCVLKKFDYPARLTVEEKSCSRSNSITTKKFATALSGQRPQLVSRPPAYYRKQRRSTIKSPLSWLLLQQRLVRNVVRESNCALLEQQYINAYDRRLHRKIKQDITWRGNGATCLCGSTCFASAKYSPTRRGHDSDIYEHYRIAIGRRLSVDSSGRSVCSLNDGCRPCISNCSTSARCAYNVRVFTDKSAGECYWSSCRGKTKGCLLLQQQLPQLRLAQEKYGVSFSCLQAKRPKAKVEKREKNYQRAYEERRRREEQQQKQQQQQQRQLLEQQEEAERQRVQQRRLSGRADEAGESSISSSSAAAESSGTLTQLMEEARVAAGEIIKHHENFVVVGSTQRRVHGRRPPNMQRYEKQHEFVRTVFEEFPLTEDELQTETIKAERAWRGDMMLDELEAEIGGPDALAPGGIGMPAR